jgi:hypothetical protein
MLSSYKQSREKEVLSFYKQSREHRVTYL